MRPASTVAPVMMPISERVPDRQWCPTVHHVNKLGQMVRVVGPAISEVRSLRKQFTDGPQIAGVLRHQRSVHPQLCEVDYVWALATNLQCLTPKCSHTIGRLLHCERAVPFQPTRYSNQGGTFYDVIHPPPAYLSLATTPDSRVIAQMPSSALDQRDVVATKEPISPGTIVLNEGC